MKRQYLTGRSRGTREIAPSSLLYSPGRAPLNCDVMPSKEETMAVLNSMKLAPLAVMLALISNSADGDGKSTVWKQEQLDETYMRSLTKEECVKKTVETLSTGCDSESCIKPWLV